MPEKIYIIEDNANILYSLQAKFSADGFKVTTDVGTDDILVIENRIKMSMPDVIIMDLILPNFDGFDLLKKLKGLDETKNTPIFVFTNLSDKDSRARGLDLGADYFFIKDEFSIDGFVDKVKKIINNKQKIEKFEK